MKIAEGSIHEIKIDSTGASVFISQGDDRWIKIHIDDLPELIKELTRISKGEEE